MKRALPFLLLFLLLGASAPAPEADYAERAAKLEGKKDAKAWLKLADFAEEQLLWEKREEALRKAVEADPKNAEAHERLDEVKVGQDWLPAAEAEAKDAEEKQAKGLVFYGAKWVPSKEADKLREADRKAVGWPLEFRLDTPHLRIYSARPLDLTLRVARLLERHDLAYRRLHAPVWKLKPPSSPLKVYFFADRKTYLDVAASEDPGNDAPDMMGGFYLNSTKTLYLGATRQDEEEKGRRQTPELILHMAVHEMTHGLDDRVVGMEGMPVWLLEGRAEYLAYAIRSDRVMPGFIGIIESLSFRQDLAGALEALRPGDVMKMTQGEFSQDGLRCYALSCAWVHFLYHGDGGRHAEGFRRFLAGCPGKSSPALLEKAVGPLSDLEPAFKRYVKETLLPMMEKAQAKP